MSTITDQGLDWYAEKGYTDTLSLIDEVAVGTGTVSDPEDLKTATGLQSEVFRATVETGTVFISDLAGTGQFQARITVSGGTEVPGNTDITELLIESSDDDVVIAIDNFDPVTVKPGQTEAFVMPVELVR